MTEFKRVEITSAAKTEIGFDYQFYYFIYLMLDLRHGEKIGIEVKDDIHIDCADGTTTLIQTKHTLQTSKIGETINLTERDKDLWKTISNWVKLIQEQVDPIDFISKTKFQLISNKSIAENPLIIKINNLREKDCKVADFKTYLKVLSENTTDDTISKYIKDFRNLKGNELVKFAEKLDFRLSQDDLINKIKERLLENIHIPERVNDVYTNLHTELRDSNYLTIKSNGKMEISFEDFNNRFRQCFKIALSNKLPIRSFDFTIPNNPEKQHFIRQLIDIGDISEKDKEDIIAFTTQMFQLYNNLKSWEESGDLLPSERKLFNRETQLLWKNSFRNKFRIIKSKIESGLSSVEIDKEIKIQAVDLLDEMRKQILKIDDNMLTIELSNGQFYYLTENKEIGWHYDWENRKL